MTKSKYIVIGGLPAPIGGVTNFLRRLMLRDFEQIKYFVDIYPGKKEALPNEILDKVKFFPNKILGFLWLFFLRQKSSNTILFFNFSTLKSLAFVAFLPKRKTTQWQLMLHHGDLKADGFISLSIYKLILRKFDLVHCLSLAQTQTYSNLGVDRASLQHNMSYLPPLEGEEDISALKAVLDIKSRFENVFIMSGYPTEIYNFEKGIATVLDRDCLVVFVYGKGPLREALRVLAQQPNIFLFEDKSEAFFNTFLKYSDCLLRLNSVDSFGIAVADAINFGVPVVATDICQRYEGATLISDLDDLTIQKAIRKSLATPVKAPNVDLKKFELL